MGLKIKVFNYTEGERSKVQWGYFCPGCKKFHYVGPEHHGFNGDLERPTFTPSVFKNWEPICHAYINDGMIQFLGDSWHELKNQTVELPDVPDTEQ
jgi:hypothetical protein